MNRVIYISLLIGLNFIILIANGQNIGYWQQQVNYHIDVRLDDEKHFLHAYEEITYINNSPDQLSRLYFHLWPNAYKNKATTFARQQFQKGKTAFYYADESQLGYIDSLNFKVNGESIQWEFHKDHIDIAILHLNEPVASGEEIMITTPFRVKLPGSFSRLGHVGQQYQITQWYPKPAVFDSRGWHPMPYLDQGEFYSEFGRFEVNITLPSNYVVGATGNLQNEAEKEFMYSLSEEKWQESLYRYSAPFQESADSLKTIRFTQENVHDFAWFADKKYRVLLGEVELPHSGRTVAIQALYTDVNYDVWEDALEYMEDALYYYSLWIGDYPYDVMTIVDGALSAGAGMEYPTITILGANSKFFLELVTMHEIGHNWFYGVLGSNERMHAWMDEGTNSYYEMRYIDTKYPDRSILTYFGGEDVFAEASFIDWVITKGGVRTLPYRKLYELEYLTSARQGLDQKLDMNAKDFLRLNYGRMVYFKTAMMYNHLSSYLGQEEFDRIMQVYFDTWQFKHPYPEDLQSLFEQESGKDLNWFFSDLVKTRDKINYAISDLNKEGKHVEVTIKNKGGVEAPFPLVGFRNNEPVTTEWIDGFTGSKTIQLNHEQLDKVVIDPEEVTLELNRSNNQARTAGLFKTWNKPKFQLIGSVDQPDRTELFFVPTAGLNTNDKFMLGGAFYNSIFPPKRTNFIVMPMYSFGLNKLAGSAELNFNIFPDQVFRQIKFSGFAESYAGFEKIEPRISLYIKPSNLQTSPRQRLDIKYTQVSVNVEALPLYPNSYNIISADYNIRQGNPIFNYNFRTGVRVKPEDFTMWEGELDLSYQFLQNTFLKTRLYYGNFLDATNLDQAFQLRMSGSYDYLMETTFLDRAGISDLYPAFNIQTDLRHGGFRSFVPVTTSGWLSALNIDLDIPYFPLFSVYGDVGLTDNTNGIFYGAGLTFTLIRNVLDFYIPLAGDTYLNDFPNDLNHIGENIRFTLQLDNISPFRMIKDNLRYNTY
ncbi:MAG: M1 family metallopeptidase [Candidatus Cyclobacteriaceae bacterium M3_2C_046]